MSHKAAQADRLTSVVLVAIGVASLIGGYTMDRLEIRQIHPASIPGLVPMILGVALMICGTILFFNARKALLQSAPPQKDTAPEGSLHNFVAAAILCTVYAGLLVGFLPFVAASALFITVFAAYFSWPHDGTLKAKAKKIAFAASFGIVLSAAISLLFRYGFLVRLP